jgi:hypothetical protein
VYLHCIVNWGIKDNFMLATLVKSYVLFHEGWIILVLVCFQVEQEMISHHEILLHNCGVSFCLFDGMECFKFRKNGCEVYS